MPTISDPAKDIADLCQKLMGNSSTERGDQHLANLLNVDPRSAEFYQLIFCIIERFDFLADTLRTIEIDDDQIDSAVGDLNHLKRAFQQDALVNPWHNNTAGGSRYLQAEYTKPIKALSPIVRQKISYPQLNQDEITEILAMLDSLEGWLNEHQLEEQDFIRQAILDGLSKFRFRLERLEWVGWGYTLDGLKEIVAAYLALERGDIAQHSANAAGMLKKVAATINGFYEKTQFAKSLFETTDFVLKTYGAISLFLDTPSIAGLLPKPD